MLRYYERNTSDLIHHAYYFALIESFSPLFIRLCIPSVINMVSYIMLILSSLYGNNFVVKLIFLLKNFVYMILVVLFYTEIFTVSSNPELILLGLYFNSFYIILNTKNNGEDPEEQINHPEDPERPTVMSTNPTSETDRDSLPSYEESFNYPNVSSG